MRVPHRTLGRTQRRASVQFASRVVGVMPVEYDGSGRVRVAVPSGPEDDEGEVPYVEVFLGAWISTSGELNLDIKSLDDFERLFDHPQFTPMQP